MDEAVRIDADRDTLGDVPRSIAFAEPPDGVGPELCLERGKATPARFGRLGRALAQADSPARTSPGCDQSFTNVLSAASSLGMAISSVTN